MPKPWGENGCLDWDAEQGTHGCQSSSVTSPGGERPWQPLTAQSRWSRLLPGDARDRGLRQQALHPSLVPAAGQCQSQGPQ